MDFICANEIVYHLCNNLQRNIIQLGIIKIKETIRDDIYMFMGTMFMMPNLSLTFTRNTRDLFSHQSYKHSVTDGMF